MLDRMNEQLLRSFWETGNLLIDAQRQAAPELKRIVSEASQDLTPPPAPASLLNFSLKPSFSPPEITIIFDLKDENWLDVQSAEAATLRIEKILTARLGVVVNELVAAASDELQAYVATRIKKFFMRYLDVVEKAAVGETKRVLRMNEGVLSSGRKAPPDTAPDPNVKLRRARERLAEGEDLIRRLKECIKLQEQPVQ
jgi:hypothetical protein